MMIKVTDQGSPIGIKVTFVDEATDLEYDPSPTFAAITPNGRKIPIPAENVTQVSTGTFTAWYSSKAMPGDWVVEAYGADDSDPVKTVDWRVRPTSVNA